MMAHAFNPQLRRLRQADLNEFDVSLVYRVSSTTKTLSQKSKNNQNHLFSLFAV